MFFYHASCLSTNPNCDLLQKDVDLSKDDLLGDILQDLHSEVGRDINLRLCLQMLLTCFLLSRWLPLKIPLQIWLALAHTEKHHLGPCGNIEEKEIPWIPPESVLYQTTDAQGKLFTHFLGG